MTSEIRTRDATAVVARLETDERAARAVAEAAVDRFASDEAAVSLSLAADGERWRVDIYFRDPPNEDAVRAAVAAAAGPRTAAAIRFARMEATDWVRSSLAGLAPVAAGRFVVHGAHDRAHVPLNRIGIEIEAALAFGTGHHGTTRGCLLALDGICKSLRNKPLNKTAPSPRAGTAATDIARVLDLGTGSGVLAIAAARALRRRVLATDIDTTAVRAARANARLNRAAAMIEIMKANGMGGGHGRSGGRFLLIFANILLGPLLRFSAPLRRLIAPGGRIVLSGIMSAQANAVIAAYRPLALEHRIDLDGWTTLILTRRYAATARRATL